MLIEGGSSSKDIFDVLSAITRQRQVMTWPANIVINEKDPDTKQIVDSFKVDIHESQKLDAAMDLLLELCEEGERTIVFSQFKDPLYEMSKRLTQAGYTNTLATGDQTDTYKREVRLDFDLKTAPVDPRWQVCFATYKAFGTGINLNAARQMIMLDDEWNPGSEDQAIGRIDRMNSIDQANVHMFRVEKSIDDFMASLIEQKREITSGFASAISTSDLVGFFNG
jgi:SNF2 family DNA or RNA helicase